MTDSETGNRNGVLVSAPGKLMISGEYAVLEGASAVVAAVSRRVHVWLVPDATPDAGSEDHVPPEAAAARSLAEERWSAQPGRLRVDVRQTRAGDQKLGVGSSAAAAAGSAGLIAAMAGEDLGDPEVRRAVLASAFAGHAAVAPRGSGADVAASTMGGFINFRRSDRGVECDAIRWPRGLETRVVWTGKQVRTSDMLECVDQLRRRDPNRYVTLMDHLRSASEVFTASLRSGDVSRVIEAVTGYHEAMGALGRASNTDIVDDTIASIARLAKDAGGAAKPSGAGGGDVALAIFPDRSAATKFEDTCEEAGLNVVHMELGVAGVRVEG